MKIIRNAIRCNICGDEDVFHTLPPHDPEASM